MGRNIGANVKLVLASLDKHSLRRVSSVQREEGLSQHERGIETGSER